MMVTGCQARARPRRTRAASSLGLADAAVHHVRVWMPARSPRSVAEFVLRAQVVSHKVSMWDQRLHAHMTVMSTQLNSMAVAPSSHAK